MEYDLPNRLLTDEELADFILERSKVPAPTVPFERKPLRELSHVLGRSLQSRPVPDRRILQELLTDLDQDRHDKEVTHGFA